MAKTCYHFLAVLSKLFTTKQVDWLWKQPSYKILPSSVPEFGPSLLLWQPSIQEHGEGGRVARWCWLWCVCVWGFAWCHLVAWRGPIKPWENYVTFCWAGPFSPIEVQWIVSCREVIFPPELCMCVWEKQGSKKKRRGQAIPLWTC